MKIVAFVLLILTLAIGFGEFLMICNDTIPFKIEKNESWTNNQWTTDCYIYCKHNFLYLRNVYVWKKDYINLLWMVIVCSIDVFIGVIWRFAT